MVERIKALCKMHNITMQKLESDLGFASGSIGKHDTIRSDRLKMIADYFNVSMEWIVSGKDFTFQIETEMLPYLADESLKRLVMYAAKIMPEDSKEKDKLVDAMIQTLTAMRGLQK